ncbi:MAG: hypothetical protein LUQ27_03910 [Methanomassiliicoccales archaeon]|nr:hypothetical protein [Methanomassiliicoccales archaeon]
MTGVIITYETRYRDTLSLAEVSAGGARLQRDTEVTSRPKSASEIVEIE